MLVPNQNTLVSAVFITFSGNCREALAYYQNCFGGILKLDPLQTPLESYVENPIVTGSLISDKIIMHGSDLVHNEGRILGNYMAVFLHCRTADERQTLIEKLEVGKEHPTIVDDKSLKLVEIVDIFEVRWILAL